MPDIFNLYQPDLSVIDDRVQSLMPQPGSTVPPPVGTVGAVGDMSRFARENHTHKSSMWAGTLPTDASGVAAFVFMPGFFDAAPVLSVDIETTDATVLYSRAITSKTKDGVTVTVKKVTTILAGLLTVSTPAAGLVVSVIARKATA